MTFLEVYKGILEDSYKKERYVKYIHDFHENWKNKENKSYSDQHQRLWDTQVKLDKEAEIALEFYSFLYSDIISFFEDRGKYKIGDINEEDLIDLLFYGNIGVKKYLPFIEKLLVGEDEKVSLGEQKEKEKDLIDISLKSEKDFYDLIKELEKIYKGNEIRESNLQLEKTELEDKILEYKEELNEKNKLIEDLEVEKNKEIRILELKIGEIEEENIRSKNRIILLEETSKELEKEAEEKINSLEEELIMKEQKILKQEELISEFSTIRGLIKRLMGRPT